MRVELATPIVLVLACSLSVGFSIIALVWVAVFSKPAKLQDLSNKVSQIDSHWLSYKASLDSMLESMSGLEESIERKRRQTAAAAAKLNGKRGENDAPSELTPQEVRAFYRRRVYGGAEA